MSNNNRVAMITGAGSGIGKSATIHLYEAGYSVVLVGRRKEPLDQVVQCLVERMTTLTSANEKQEPNENDMIVQKRTLVVPTDVTQPDQVQDLFQQCQEKFGRLDVLFNNAGTNSPPVNDFGDISIQEWKQVMDINVLGSFLCAQQAWKLMKHNNNNNNGGGGRIINNGSISAHTPRPNSAPYTTSKHAMTGLTKSINLDGRKYNICCSQIDIGNAMTTMTERMTTQGVVQANGQLAIEPTISVDLVGETIVYLANLPFNANVPFMTLMATQMPFMGRG